MAYGYVPPATYRDPNDKYSANPQGNYGQQSDFFKNQQYTNPYADFTKTAMADSAGYNAKQPTDPFGAGGALFNPATFGARFGYSGYGDINSPWAKAQMATHMGNLQGGIENTLQDYARAAAQGGVASGRGGFGVTPGGAGPEAVAQQNAMRTGAAQYAGNYGQSMGYLKSQSDTMSAQAAAMANLYGNLYDTNAKTGLGYAGLGLQGTQGDAAAQEAWNNRMLGAYTSDVADRNRRVEQAPDVAYKRKMEQQAQTDAQFKRDQAAEGQAGLRGSVARGTETLGPWAWDAGMGPIWQQEAGVTPGTYGALAAPQRQAAAQTQTTPQSNPYAYAQYQDQVRRSF